MTLSPQARIAALVGVLLIALAGSAFFLFHGKSRPTAATTPPAPAAHPTHHPTASPPVHHVVAPAVNPLLPTRVRIPLEHYRIVVVGFYNPKSPVTERTILQTRAGAAEAHVGFVAANVLHDSIAGPLTALLPNGQLLPNPGFAIYNRSGTIVFRSDGYLNEDAVAQAIAQTR
jgi:hypothetical protein